MNTEKKKTTDEPAEQHLRWRYGPCWRDVVDVIETLRSASPEQVTALDAAWHAVRSVAVDAERRAAWIAARDAVRAAVRRGAVWDAAVATAWDAAEDTAPIAARAVARDAAAAASVADLIGTHGYTRQHHDVLVGPFVAVFGDLWKGL
jgi:isopropylmalate/homocitrate/citramalate synthase